MEEEQKETVEETKTSEEEKGLPEGVGKALSIAALIFLALAIAGIAYVFTPKKSAEQEATPTPEITLEPEETEEASPSATPTEEPTEEPSAEPSPTEEAEVSPSPETE